MRGKKNVDPTKYNPFRTEDVSGWLESIETYVKETNVSILDLRHKETPVKEADASFLNLNSKRKFEYGDGSLNDKTLDLPFEVVESILQRIASSQVTELRFDFVKFSKKRGGFQNFFKKLPLCKLLKNTNIKKLDFGNRELTFMNELALLAVVYRSNVEDCGEFVFDLESREIFSRLAKLNVRIDCDWPVERLSAWMFAKELPQSSLTSLRLIFSLRFDLFASNVHKIAASIFSKLPQCQITELDLSSNENGDDLVNALSPHLASSKLEILNLSDCYITDSGLDVLAQGLVGSKVSVLDVSSNKIKGLNNFGQYVPQTNITVLNLKGNSFERLLRGFGIEHRQMFAFPDFLAGSQVESLDVSKNNFNRSLCIELLQSLKLTNVTKLKITSPETKYHQYITEFATALSDTKVEHVELGLPATAVEVFSELLKDSKVKSIKFQNNLLGPADPIRSLNLVKGSSISTLKFKGYEFSSADVELMAEVFVGTNITYLGFEDCQLNGFVTFFAPHLKNTSITHLSIKGSHLQDEDIVILAESLKTTKITKLDLSWNEITCVGAETLSIHVPRTNVISLDLHHNEIKDDGLEFLAKGFSGSFLTTLEVSHNPGRKFLPIQKVVFENRVRSHKLVAFYKQLVVDISKGNFCFSPCAIDMSDNDFLQACLTFYKSVAEQPAAITVLINEESVAFSREELVRLFEKFPAQFSQFIRNEIKADVLQHVALLEKADELGLAKIIELLLLNKSMYYINETDKILHPSADALLLKYKLPVKSTGVARIFNYFK